MIVLDTSAIVEILRGTDIGKRIAEKFNKDIKFTTAISAYELMLGIKDKDTIKVESFLNDLDILDFDIKAGKESAQIEKELKSKGNLINKIDILISGICKNYNATILTLDHDFLKIKGIKDELID